MMLCGSNQLIHGENEEPQRNVGNIQSFYNKLRMKLRLHMDAFDGIRINSSPSISASYLDSLALHQVETAIKIRSYLLVFNHLQVPHFIKWWLLAQGSFGQWQLIISVWSAPSDLWNVSPRETTGQMNAKWPRCNQTHGPSKMALLNLQAGFDCQIWAETHKTLHRHTFYLDTSMTI